MSSKRLKVLDSTAKTFSINTMLKTKINFISQINIDESYTLIKLNYLIIFQKLAQITFPIKFCLVYKYPERKMHHLKY